MSAFMRGAVGCLSDYLGKNIDIPEKFKKFLKLFQKRY